jgi:hypothetical protein
MVYLALSFPIRSARATTAKLTMMAESLMDDMMTFLGETWRVPLHRLSW